MQYPLIIKNTNNNKLLRTKSLKISFPISSKHHKLFKDMIKYVNDSTDLNKAKKNKLLPAIGISAIQVGFSIKAFYAHLEKTNFKIFMINPIIVNKSIIMCHLEHGEGCLSVPEKTNGLTNRYLKITIKGFEYFSKKTIEKEFSGLEAIIIQHELDHLNGMLYIDKLIPKEDPLRLLNNSIKI